VIDKENLIEFLLDSVHYLYIKSNPNPSFYPALPYESLFSHTSINKKRKEKKKKKKKNNWKLKEKKKKRNMNINLAILPSYIYPELQKPLDHVSLIIEVGIKKVNTDITIRSIKKDSNEEKEFTQTLIDSIEHINMSAIMSREAL